MSSVKILVINPKPTATQIAVYDRNQLQFLKMINHKTEVLNDFKHVNDQESYRMGQILEQLKENDIELASIRLVMARGGLLAPMESGVYEVNDLMREDLKQGLMGSHAVNLGGLLAYDIIQLIPGAKAMIANPVVVDELDDISRVTGLPQIKRRSVFHALNQKLVARKYAKSKQMKYEELNLIVVHSGGGGISVGAHKGGRVIDVNQAFDGQGPFAMERTGSLPTGELVKMCYSGKYSLEEMMCMITSRGGLKAYLETSSVSEVEDRIAHGDDHARFIMDAMLYQVAKEVGAMCMAFEDAPDAILLSGHLFHYERIIHEISRRIKKIAPISVYPNENYVAALADNAQMVLSGEIDVKAYKKGVE